MDFPNDRKYTDKHVWVQKDGDVATFGLTEYYYKKVGQVTSMSDLSPLNTNLHASNTMGMIVRDDNTSDPFVAPLDGHVIDREDHLLDIGDVNSTPYDGDHWFIKVDGVADDQYDRLWNSEQYTNYINSL